MNRYRKDGQTTYFVAKSIAIHNPFLDLTGEVLDEDPVYYYVRQGVPAPVAREAVKYHRQKMHEALNLYKVIRISIAPTHEQREAFWAICEEVTDPDTYADFMDTQLDEQEALSALLHLEHASGEQTVDTLFEQGIIAIPDPINRVYNFYDRKTGLELRPQMDNPLEEDEVHATTFQASMIRAFIYTYQTVPVLMGAQNPDMPSLTAKQGQTIDPEKIRASQESEGKHPDIPFPTAEVNRYADNYGINGGRL